MNYKFGARERYFECRGDIRYGVRFQLEPVVPKLLDLPARIGETASGRACCTIRRQRPHGPGCPKLHRRRDSHPQVLVQAFHTFPDDYAIVRSQSMFLLPERVRP